MLEFIRGLFKAEEKKSEPVKGAENSGTKKASANTKPENNFNLNMSYFEDAYRKFVQGDESKLSAIYSYLASGNAYVTARAADAIARYMEKLDYNGICRLDDWFRQSYSMEGCIDWKRVDFSTIKTMTREDYLWVLRLGTLHPTGYFRMKCVRKLKGDKKSVPFIILRLNDWVLQVRTAAEEACAEITDMIASEVITYILYLEKVKRGGRARNSAVAELENEIREAAVKRMNVLDESFVSLYDEKTRRAVYRFFADGKIFGRDEINNLISVEKNGQMQALLMTLLIQNYEVTAEELDRYLNRKSSSVKYKALVQKYKLIRDYWEGLENLLLSRSGAIRSYARYIIRNHTSIDLSAYYSERLETADKKVCIQGLGECGAREDAETLKPYLEDSEEGIVKVTLHAIGSLLREDGAEIYWRFLQDTREVVARQAYREIAAHDVRYGAEKIFNLLTETESELLKEKLTLMLLKEPVWDALPYRLMLYTSEDEAIKSIIHPFKGRISTYSTMSAEHAEWIKSIMTDDKYKIPKDLQDQILFSMKYSIK